MGGEWAEPGPQGWVWWAQGSELPGKGYFSQNTSFIIILLLSVALSETRSTDMEAGKMRPGPLPDEPCELAHILDPTPHLHRGPTSTLFSETRLWPGARDVLPTPGATRA